MERHDVVSWTIMVTGLGQHGKAKVAVDVLKEMVTKGMKADTVTFLPVAIVVLWMKGFRFSGL